MPLCGPFSFVLRRERCKKRCKKRKTEREKQKDRERLNGGKKMNGILGDSSNRANREKEKKWKRKNLQ